MEQRSVINDNYRKWNEDLFLITKNKIMICYKKQKMERGSVFITENETRICDKLQKVERGSVFNYRKWKKDLW